MATTMTTLWACRQPRLATLPRASLIGSGSRRFSLFFGDDLGSSARLATSLTITRTTSTPANPRGRIRVQAAAKEKEDAPKKKRPSAVKRAMISEKRRVYNKARKSEIRTRMKKALTALEDLKKKADGAQPEELKPIEVMIGEAYSIIDKAVKVRTLHRNTGGRRKSRLARAKKAVEVALGWYDPANPAPPAVRPPRPVRSASTPTPTPALAEAEAAPAPAPA